MQELLKEMVIYLEDKFILDGLLIGERNGKAHLTKKIWLNLVF